MADGSAGPGAGVLRKGKVNVMLVPLPGIDSKSNGAAHQFDDLLGQRQPQSGALVGAAERLVGLAEFFEYQCLRLRGVCRCRCR